MRTIVGVIAVLGLAVAVAEAQPPRERAATFKPPQALQPDEVPAVARGAAEEFPPSGFLPSTPVARPTHTATRPPGGVKSPAWLTDENSNVLPAAGIGSKAGGVRTLTPPATQPKDDPSFGARGLDKLKGLSLGGEKTRPQPPAQPVSPQQPQEQPTAASPFRGTSATGAPVYAGPPAYRWYGWGSVTPGANQFAPAGQYPKASANWYSITGATPGAFPVPVMNPLRTPPGTEPPNYSTARTQPPQPVVPVSSQPQPQPRPQPVPQPTDAPKFNPPGDSKFSPGSGVGSLPPTSVSVPKITPPTSLPVAVAPPVVPAPVTVKEVAPIAQPAPTTSEPIVALPPPVLPPVPTLPVLPPVELTKPANTDTPSPLPISVTAEPKPEAPKPEAPKREEQRWQPTTEPAQPAPGTWAPAGAQPAPTQPGEPAPAWKSGGANVKPVVARAQMPDNKPDPVAALIQQVCQGRAADVEVRWTGMKKLSVCFEIRTSAEAQKLVTDISRRPELAAYQIDFCVVVK